MTVERHRDESVDLDQSVYSLWVPIQYQTSRSPRLAASARWPMPMRTENVSAVPSTFLKCSPG